MLLPSFTNVWDINFESLCVKLRIYEITADNSQKSGIATFLKTCLFFGTLKSLSERPTPSSCFSLWRGTFPLSLGNPVTLKFRNNHITTSSTSSLQFLCVLQGCITSIYIYIHKMPCCWLHAIYSNRSHSGQIHNYNNTTDKSISNFNFFVGKY